VRQKVTGKNDDKMELATYPPQQTGISLWATRKEIPEG